MNDCLFNRLSAAKFAVIELNLYLDTHPDDEEMKALWAEYVRKANDLTMQYEAQYGPLTITSGSGCDWIKEPWPWQWQGGNG